MFAFNPSVLGMNSFAFVSQASIDKNITPSYNLRKKLTAVKNCRTIGKKDMKWNDYCPSIQVDPETYEVTVDGKLIKVGPCDRVPMAQNVYMF